MRILLVGAGRMGFALAQQLDREGHHVFVIDTDDARVEMTRTRLDVMAVEGSGCSLEALRELGVRDADLMIAVSGSDEVNIVSCLIGRELGIKRRLARIESRELAENIRSMPTTILGVDEFVNPREVTVERLHHIVNTPGTTMSAEFEDGRVILRGFMITTESELTLQPLQALQALFADHFLVAAVKRGEDLIVPTGGFQIELGDIIYVVMAAPLLNEFLRVFHFDISDTRRVFVYGASEIGLDLCQRLEKEIADVVLIDQDAAACRDASEHLHKTSVIHGSPLDQDLMIDLRVDRANCFLGLSRNEETNFSSTLLAKRLGASYGVMLTEEPTHVELFDTLPLDAVVNPAMLSVGAILRAARAGQVLSLFKIAGDRGEAIEIIVSDNAPAAGKALKDIVFPTGSMIASVNSHGGPKVPSGGTVIEAGDRVVLVALSETIRKAVGLFTGL